MSNDKQPPHFLVGSVDEIIAQTMRELAPGSADEAVERYAEEHAAEWREHIPMPFFYARSQREAARELPSLADHIFETLLENNRILAAINRRIKQ